MAGGRRILRPHLGRVRQLPGFLGGARSAIRIKETLKGLVHYDEWSTDPLRAVTATILDVASFAIPFAGAASKVGKFGKAGSVTARVGRVLEIVDKILQFTDPLGILTDIPMSKLTDTVVNALNITFDPTDLVAKWTGADAPAVDAPGVGGSTRGVDGASEVNVPEFDYGGRRTGARYSGSRCS